MTPRAVLIGPPAAGKTRLGKRIARRLGVGFVDTDSRVVADHGPIPAIFKRFGEPQFREWERAAVVEALTTDGVVSLGGGAIVDDATQRDLENLTVILVTASPEKVAPRLLLGNRPLLADGIESWKRLVAARQPIYDRLADIVVDTGLATMDSIADDVAAQLRLRT
ncbi:MAG: shikimate kinase [Microbacteriaceae bacterium]|nr:shikimate kinase [Microbacteriaceae bacterium]